MARHPCNSRYKAASIVTLSRPNAASRILSAMPHDLVCWKCGNSLAAMSLPLMRADACPKCRAELHVCKMCTDYDPRVAHQCREPTADEVSDKTRANFCGHFKPRAAAYTAPNTDAVSKSMSELEKLFGKK